MRTNYELRTTNHAIKTPALGDASLSFVRPKHHHLTYNPIAMSRLLLGDYKHQITSLLRPCPSLRRLSYIPHPTTHNPSYNPPHDADLSFVRHQLPFFTPNPHTINNLSLCAKKRRISGLVRHSSIGNPHHLSHNHLLGRGAAGVISAAGINCMIGTIAGSMVPALRSAYGNAPILSLVYGSSEGPGQRIRLETFVHQVRERWRRNSATNRPGPGAPPIGHPTSAFRSFGTIRIRKRRSKSHRRKRM